MNRTWEKTSKGNEEKNGNRRKRATGRNYKENGKRIKTSMRKENYNVKKGIKKR